jgi:hypothetical protein
VHLSQAKISGLPGASSPRLKCGLILLFGSAVLTAGSQAALPLSAYKEQQAKAPEALVIKIQSVSRREVSEEKWKRIDFTVKAQVQKVIRTATGLTPGTVIDIAYSRRQYYRPIVGPTEIPALEEGQVCPAYLAAEGKSYWPTAGGHSFDTVD